MVKSDSLQRSLTTVAKGATIVFAGMVAGKILGTVNQILLGRLMGPEDYGRFNIVLSVISIAFSIATFGLFGALARFIPFNLKLNRLDNVKSVIDFSAGFVLVTCSLAAAVIFIFSDRIAAGFFHDSELAPLLRVFSIGMPVIGLNRVCIGMVRGFKAVKLNAIIFNVANRIIKILIFLLFVALGYRLYGAIFAFIGSAVATVIISIWFVRNRLFVEYSDCSRVPIARKILGFSWPLALTGLTFLFVSKTDMMLLGYFLDSKHVGIYTPAIMIAKLLIFIGMAFKFIFLPVVSEFFAHDDIEGLRSLYKSTSKWIVLIVLPGLIFFVLFPRDILRLLYGSEFTAGYLALIILSCGISMDVFQGTSGNILVGSGYTKLNLLGEVIAAVSNVILNIILIPAYGITGAAIATSLSYLFRNISFVTIVYKKLGIHPYKRSYLYVLASSLIVLVLVYILKIYSPLQWWINMIVLGILMTVAYFVTLLLTGSFDENDLVVVEGLERKTGLRLGFLKKYINR
ncbi:MAG: oligosaccharide flippase family protein [Candidatus Latescibacteria bacterium]|nr:oligosaccharide flippase family protein [bacterium]MBD3423927.1 oligosaccharide flippase family protein [Candidatus Latescibacterota bacterium]